MTKTYVIMGSGTGNVGRRKGSRKMLIDPTRETRRPINRDFYSKPFAMEDGKVVRTSVDGRDYTLVNGEKHYRQ